MAQTVVRARESTANIASGRIKRFVDTEVHRLTPDAAPLTVLMRQARSRSIRSTKPEWFERELPAKWDQVNNATGYTDAATDIVVDNAAYFSIRDIVNVPRTGEKMRVSAVNTATNTLTVARSVGPTAAAALVDNDDLQIIGNAYAEGAAKGLEKTHQDTNPFNLTQIFRTPFGETESERQTDNYTGGEKDLMREKLIEHMIDIERAMLFGERTLDTTDTAKPTRYTGGALFYLDQNITDAGGALTQGEVETWAQSVFKYTGAGESRLLLASPLVVSTLSQIAAANIQTVSDKNATYGIRVVQWTTAHGTLNIVKHRLLENGAGGNGYGGYAIAVDPSKLQYFYVGDRNTSLKRNIEDAGDDAYTHEYLTECCMAFHNPSLHGILKGVTGAA